MHGILLFIILLYFCIMTIMYPDGKYTKRMWRRRAVSDETTCLVTK